MAKKPKAPKGRYAMILRMPESLRQKLVRMVSAKFVGGDHAASRNSVICELIETAEEKRP